MPLCATPGSGAAAPTRMRGGSLAESAEYADAGTSASAPSSAATSSSPASANVAAAHPARLPARGGSFHYAFRGAGSSSYLFTAPQLGYSIPELFVELEVHAPGLDVRGVTAPGIPVIAAGHNGRIAWGITNLAPDVTDFYLEQLQGDRYLRDGRLLPLRTRQETINVKGSAPVTIWYSGLSISAGAPLASAVASGRQRVQETTRARPAPAPQ